jgi:hypothetical protein
VTKGNCERNGDVILKKIKIKVRRSEEILAHKLI